MKLYKVSYPNFSLGFKDPDPVTLYYTAENDEKFLGVCIKWALRLRPEDNGWKKFVRKCCRKKTTIGFYPDARFDWLSWESQEITPTEARVLKKLGVTVPPDCRGTNVSLGFST